MVWIWSDELAAAAEEEGLEHSEIASWKRRPVAYELRGTTSPATLARVLLGLDAADESTVDTAPGAACTCGRVGEISEPVLAPPAATG